MMSVSDAVASRLSVRDFLSTPVDEDLLRQILEKAARAPSGGNLQPWRTYVINGPAMDRFLSVVAANFDGAATAENRPAHLSYPEKLKEPYRSNRFKCGMDLYQTLDIQRGDKEKRLAQFRRNFDFFGAPCGLMFYIDKQMGPIQWTDMGIYMQTVMLLLREAGLDSCAQGVWTRFPDMVSDFVGAPDDWMLVCGMSVGYRDESQPVNSLITDRDDLAVSTIFIA